MARFTTISQRCDYWLDWTKEGRLVFTQPRLVVYGIARRPEIWLWWRLDSPETAGMTIFAPVWGADSVPVFLMARLFALPRCSSLEE
jgi:hypothetical protein